MPTEQSEAKVKTKARFEEVFKNYSALAAEKKKSRKKSVQLQDSIVLETLRNKLGLHKESESDETILNNTYNREEESPRFTKNKLKDRVSVAEKVNNDALYKDTENPAKGKKKKKKSAIEEQSFNEEKSYKSATQILEEQLEAVSIDQTKSQASTKSETRQQKSKKKKSKNELEHQHHVETVLKNDEGDDADSLIQAYQKQITENDAKVYKKGKRNWSQAPQKSFQLLHLHFNNELMKEKKQKQHILFEEGETSAMSLSELQGNQAENDQKRKKIPQRRKLTSESKLEVINDEDKKTIEEEGVQQKAKGKKAKKKSNRATAEEIEAKEPKDETATPDLDAEPQQQRPKYDDSLILGVYIHRTERLKTDLLVSHPTVKVHVVDETTGQYIRKEHSNRHVTSYYEQESVEHILPIMTQPYDFKKNKLTVPEWEEQIIFNERFGYFLQETEESPKVILFFEILDFVSMDKARINYETQNREGGWRRVAWAFLKLVGANGILNVDGKLRLQLYYPTSKVKKLSNSIEVFEWWNKLPWKYYPSTLYVTVKGLKLPENIALSVRSMLPVQQERGTISYSDLQTVMSQKISTSVADTQKAEILKWNKLPGQVCRIPNKFELSLRGGQIGCFCIIFSHNGRSLAAACANRDGYPIVVYEISSGQVLGEFNGHLSIVYSLCWSNDDNTLLSASSDGTVRVWDKESYHNPAKKVLPHPSFIYTAKYHPLAQYLVVTGGYDFVIRVWNINTKDAHGQLLQEFNGHKSFINTLCFDAEGQHMFSGDNLGLIIVWNTSVKEDTEENLLQQWSIDKEIKENELKGVSVNHLEVHPNGRRLLIHAKDSTLRVMDLRVLATKKYTGATNYHEQICSTFTPCGTFLFAGSEDGICYVWNSETGDQVAMYTELNYASPVRDVAFHPHENMVAFCAFGPSQPILIFLYDQKVAQQDVQTMKGICRLRTTATPGGPKIFGRHADVLNMSYSSFSSADHFTSISRQSLKLQKVRQKLDSVLESMENISEGDYYFAQPGMVPFTVWDKKRDSNFTSMDGQHFNISRSRLFLPAPSLLSPHSKLRLPTTVSAHVLPKQSLTSHTGVFNPIRQNMGGPPSVRLQTTYSYPATPLYKVEVVSSAPVQETVVALYDYTAHRSDELTLQRYDIIQVLYKDNENWWFGRLANGQQGYFPANYVADARIPEEELTNNEDHNPVVPNGNDEVEERSPTPTKMSAVISKAGELKLIAEYDTDTESPVKPLSKKKKVRQANAAISQSTSLVTSEESGTSVKSMKKRKKKTGEESSVRGEVNAAFVLG
eukprot:gi/632951288/ref/XP_007891207.1/ PREDICTED: LOW QUALITY PROTEIN: jouberin [Callorhinchus milii]